jgi:uncharacterized protein
VNPVAKSALAERMQSEIISAMKSKDKARLGVLRMMNAAIKQVEVDERRDLADADVVKVLNSYGRKVKDQIKSYGEGGREDLLEAAKTELKIVSEFLPEEMTDADLEKIVIAAVEETGASGPQDMGKVMKVVMAKTAGRADGSKISSLVKKTLLG